MRVRPSPRLQRDLSTEQATTFFLTQLHRQLADRNVVQGQETYQMLVMKESFRVFSYRGKVQIYRRHPTTVQHEVSLGFVILLSVRKKTM